MQVMQECMSNEKIIMKTVGRKTYVRIEIQRRFGIKSQHSVIGRCLRGFILEFLFRVLKSI